MTPVDRRLPMSHEAFDGLAINDTYPIVSYFEALIHLNDRIDKAVYLESERLKDLSDGQRLLVQMAEFDGQVKNGGITQFFWNYLEWITDVKIWIDRVGAKQVLESYLTAVDTLNSKLDAWSAIRTSGHFEEGEALLGPALSTWLICCNISIGNGLQSRARDTDDSSLPTASSSSGPRSALGRTAF